MMKILNTTQPYNLFGIEDQDYSAAKVVAVPVPYDSTTTYRGGARDGPRAIIEASRIVEFYNEEVGADVSKLGIFTTEELAPDFHSPERMVKRIEKEVSLLLEDGKFPLLIGGEHTVALGSISALRNAGKDFTVLYFDAHSDARDEFMGSKYCHACVAARAREICGSCYTVGVRSTTEESAKKHAKSTLFMKDMRGMTPKQIADKIVKNTKGSVYLTIDLDVIDSGEMPSVGTPEPDGMRFGDIKEVLRLVLARKRLLGMDVVELAPIPGMAAPNYLAAKLTYLILGFSDLMKR